MFKASIDLNIEGNKQIITREPGIYQVHLIEVVPGDKAGASKDDPRIPTIDYTVQVDKVEQLHDRTLDAKEIVGKIHMDQIKLDVTTQEEFDKKVKRIAHVLTKAGVDKAAIIAVTFKDAKQYQKDICALFDAAKHNQPFRYRTIGGVMNGTAFTQAPGYLGFATTLDEEQKFSSQEIKNNNAYYTALNNTSVMPSDEPGGAGAGAATGDAF